jgi:hypothetical protein
MIEVKETAELHNLLGDVEERAGNRIGAAAAYQRAARMEPTEEHLFDIKALPTHWDRRSCDQRSPRLASCSARAAAALSARG